MDNLGWGLQMTVLGMGLVFGLLALLWGMLVLVLRFDAAPEVKVSPDARTVEAEQIASVAEGAIGKQVPVMPTVRGMDADLVAAITVATLTHVAVRRRQAAPAMRLYWPGSLLYASRWVASGRVRQNRSWMRRGGQ
jgi:Na+-transporting methylmalonyl-CoA/oxaloacetate decarboxylase gamma subunit